MDKELTEVTMFSKMGKYISNKILKHNRANRKSQKKIFPTPSYDYLGNKHRRHQLHHSTEISMKSNLNQASSDL